jgi:hypothetical protein
MTSRSSSRNVLFEHAFILPGMSGPLPGGIYELRIEEEQLDLMWEAYHTRMALVVALPGGEEQWPITTETLEALLAFDRQD